MALLGPSGAGKTTLLRVIAGLERPDEGEVRFDGRVVTSLEPRARDVAMVFEGYALYPQLTVFDNMAFPLRAPRNRDQYPESEIARVIPEVADLLEITPFLHRLPRELSGGQRQRVALGRCLVRRPAVYLLDEPIAHLDAKLRHQMRAELRHFQGQVGITTLWATPDQLEAVSMAERIAVLAGGGVAGVGSPDELYERPGSLTVARLVGDPPMNVLEARVEPREDKVGLRLAGHWIALRPALSAAALRGSRNGRVVVGVRASDLTLGPGDGDGIPAEVYVVEPLGTGVVATVRLGDVLWKVKTRGEVRLRLGEPIRLGVRLDKIHLFDPLTELAIR